MKYLWFANGVAFSAAAVTLSVLTDSEGTAFFCGFISGWSFILSFMYTEL